MNHSFGMALIIIIISVVVIFFIYNAFADFYNKKKLKAFLEKSFKDGDFKSLNNMEYEHEKAVKAFGRNEREDFNDADLAKLSHVLNVKVKNQLPDFFKKTYFPEVFFNRNTNLSHIVLKVFKRKYISVLGKKEYLSVIIDMHYGKIMWMGEERSDLVSKHYFDVGIDGFETAWNNFKEKLSD